MKRRSLLTKLAATSAIALPGCQAGSRGRTTETTNTDSVGDIGPLDEFQNCPTDGAIPAQGEPLVIENRPTDPELAASNTTTTRNAPITETYLRRRTRQIYSEYISIEVEKRIDGDFNLGVGEPRLYEDRPAQVFSLRAFVDDNGDFYETPAIDFQELINQAPPRFTAPIIVNEEEYNPTVVLLYDCDTYSGAPD
jgi:hypothetical protein